MYTFGWILRKKTDTVRPPFHIPPFFSNSTVCRINSENDDFKYRLISSNCQKDQTHFSELVSIKVGLLKMSKKVRSLFVRHQWSLKNKELIQMLR